MTDAGANIPIKSMFFFVTVSQDAQELRTRNAPPISCIRVLIPSISSFSLQFHHAWNFVSFCSIRPVFPPRRY